MFVIFGSELIQCVGELCLQAFRLRHRRLVTQCCRLAQLGKIGRRPLRLIAQAGEFGLVLRVQSL